MRDAGLISMTSQPPSETPCHDEVDDASVTAAFAGCLGHETSANRVSATIDADAATIFWMRDRRAAALPSASIGAVAYATYSVVPSMSSGIGLDADGLTAALCAALLMTGKRSGRKAAGERGCSVVGTWYDLKNHFCDLDFRFRDPPHLVRSSVVIRDTD